MSKIFEKLSIEFERYSRRTISCYVAVGMITDNIFDFALRRLSECNDIKIITGVHMATTPEVMQKLKKLSDGKKIKSYAYVKKFFHPKMYLFKVDDKWKAFIGSGNMTRGGWAENKELFIEVSDQEVCHDLLEQFHQYEIDSVTITDELIETYRENYNANKNLDEERRKNNQNLIARLTSSFNIDIVDFTNQYFFKEDHLAFQPGKTHLDTPEIYAERRAIRKKLYTLNDMLAPEIIRKWDLHPHYKDEHIASHVETAHHHEANVRSLWIGYGRHETQLKKYGKYSDSNNTPLFYMRMQVIVSYDNVGVWLMPGKSGAGEIDRENFKSKLENLEFSQKFYDTLKSLGEPYWIIVAEKTRKVKDFENAEDLRQYLWNDNWRKYYFIIGRDYSLGSAYLKKENIVRTCVNDFSKYMPLYDMIRDKTFD